LLTATISERTQSEHRLRLAFAELAKSNETLELRVQQRTEELHDNNLMLQQTMETLKQTQLQILQIEKMSALGQMMAGIAHEINNPINFIHGNISHVDNYAQDLLTVVQQYQSYYPNPPQKLQQLLKEVDMDFLQEDLSKLLKSMKGGSERIRNIVLSLRNFSRLDEAEFKAVNLHEGIDNTLLILQHRLKEKADLPAIEVSKHYDQLPLVECYPAQLNQVFMNLLINSIDAVQDMAQQQGLRLPDGNRGKIAITTKLVDQNRVQITIADNGLGIPEDLRSRIFDPFFTTKPVNQGTGLGLSICYQIVAGKHHGKIWCESNPGVGTQFFVEIPIYQRGETASV
jgi:two-component system, NtrC family, sensor kinase